MARDEFDRYADHLNDVFESVWLEVEQQQQEEMAESSVKAIARWGFLRGYIQRDSTGETDDEN